MLLTLILVGQHVNSLLPDSMRILYRLVTNRNYLTSSSTRGVLKAITKRALLPWRYAGARMKNITLSVRSYLVGREGVDISSSSTLSHSVTCVSCMCVGTNFHPPSTAAVTTPDTLSGPGHLIALSQPGDRWSLLGA